MQDSSGDENRGAQMQAIRSQIDQGLEDVSAHARNLVDWRHYATTHPWLCLGAAAAVGFLIVPQRPAAMRLDSAALSDLTKSHPLVVTSAVAHHGLVRMLLGTVARLAVREATAYAGNHVAGFYAHNQGFQGKP
jgi:hypothetical protein